MIPAGVIAVMEVAETKLTPVAELPPMVTVAPETKPAPEIVTGVPPVTLPVAGEILEKVGAAALAAGAVTVPRSNPTESTIKIPLSDLLILPAFLSRDIFSFPLNRDKNIGSPSDSRLRATLKGSGN